MTRGRPGVNKAVVLLVGLSALAAPASAQELPPLPLPGQATEAAERTEEAAEAAREGAPSAEGATAEAPPSGPLDLRTAVERARRADYRVRAALAQVRVFEARLDEARWAWFPTFATSLTFGGPVPEARLREDATSPFDVTEASMEGDLNWGRMGVYTAGRIEAALPLWTFGKLTGFESAMEDLVDAGRADVARSRDAAGLDAARAFYGYQAARMAIEDLDEGIERARAAEARVQRMLELGSEQALPEDVQKTRLLVHHLQGQRARLVEARATAAAALALLAGVPRDTDLQVVEADLTLPPPPALGLDALVAQARAGRPELVAVQSALSARREEVQIRKAMHLPDLVLAGFGEFAWSNAATDQKNPFVWDRYNDLDGGVGLLLRGTFDVPQKNARVEQARGEVAKLEAQAELLRRAVGLEVEQAWRELRAARAEADRLAAAVKEARRWVVSAMATFELGIGQVRDVLEPIALSAATGSMRAQAVHRARMAEARLARALGVRVWEVAELGRPGRAPRGPSGVGPSAPNM